MNTVQVLDVLSEAIEKRPPSSSEKYYICYIKGKLCCHPVNASPIPEITFGTFRESYLTKGLTYEQWLILAGKIQTFFRQKGIA